MMYGIPSDGDRLARRVFAGLFLLVAQLTGPAAMAREEDVNNQRSAELGGKEIRAAAIDDEQGVLMMMPERFRRNWDDDVGLWTGKGKGGTESHVIRANAAKLVNAGIAGVLDRVPAARVLANLRRAQETDGPLRGNFWWHWEDKAVTDRNSGFFTTLQLLALHFEFRATLGEAARADLDHLLAEARHWFAHKVYPITESKLRYPNAYYGDAVCLWLLSELEGEVTEELAADMLQISRYYLESPWGWGEHLSDLYRKIFQRELVAMLLWARQMPPELRLATDALVDDLVKVDGLFADGPCVPTIRCYWMDSSPKTPESESPCFRPYAELMTEDVRGDFTMAWFAYRAGLQQRFKPPRRESEWVSVDSHGGTQALARVTERWRYGTMTRYPLFPDTNAHAKWGLHWQSMPMAYWHANGDWAYLQWLTEENGCQRAHPGLSRRDTQANNLHRLSDADPEAAFGWTLGTRRGDGVLIHRKMPKVAASWSWVADRFRLLNPTADKMSTDQVGDWQRLLLDYGTETLTVACLPLQPGVACRLNEKPGGELQFSARLGEAAAFDVLWYIRMGDGPSEPPVEAVWQAWLKTSRPPSALP